MIFSWIFIDYSLVISYNTVIKTSCVGAIRGLWDELNQGLFPWIDLKAVLNVKDTKELVRMLRAEPLSRRLCGWDSPGLVP